MEFSLEKARYVYNPDLGIWSAPNFTGIAYNDGDEVEKRIANAFSNVDDLSVLSTELKQHCIDWPSHYHLSSARSNLMRPFEQMLASSEILEIGAGCGAITRYMGEVGGKVLALEGSPRRAAITRSRTRDLKNITVVSEAFDDFKCDRKFDVVTLIGVLEYANIFTQCDHPHLQLLHRARRMLKPGGRLIIAIENQLGLKYFSGAPEDHIGQAMFGIEGQYRSDQPQTFGREALTRLLKDADFPYTEFLAPYPDYKLPLSIITEQGFSTKEFNAAALASATSKSDMQMPVLCNFSLELAYPEVFGNKLGLDMANSFLVVATQKKIENFEKSALAFHYSTSRVADFCKETLFTLKSDKSIEVKYRSLGTRSSQSKSKNKLIGYSIPKSADYILGNLLSLEFAKIVMRDGWSYDQVATYLRQYLDILSKLGTLTNIGNLQISANTKIAGKFFDAIPGNIIMCPDGTPKLIDQEWIAKGEIEIGHLLFRAVIALINMMTRFGRPKHYPDSISRSQFLSTVIRKSGISLDASDYERYVNLESRIQQEITGSYQIDFYLSFSYKGSYFPLPTQTLEQGMRDRESQIASLESQITSLEQSVKSLHNSRSWKITAPMRMIATQIKRIVTYFRFAKSLVSAFGYRQLFLRAYRVLRGGGVKELRYRIKYMVNRSNVTWKVVHHSNGTAANNLSPPHEARSDIPNGPKISIVVAVYKTPMDMLQHALQSVLAQGYQNWELVIVDDKSDDEKIHSFLSEFAAKDSRIKYIERSENGGISAANNTALGHVTNPFYTVLDHDDALAPHALYSVAKTIQSHPNVNYIYSDEDKMSKNGEYFFGPFFKPSWSPEYMLAMMYTCHMSIFKTEIVQQLGGYDSAFDGAQDYELALRVLNETNEVQHIPEILYHWRVWENSTAQSIDAKPLAIERAEAALRNHLEAKQDNFVISEGPVLGHFSVDFLPKSNPLVSIIIPTANGSIDINGKSERHIDAVCASILSRTDYKNYEIVIVHNGDLDPKQIAFFEFHKNIRLSHYMSAQFSLSEKINQGADVALGEYLVIMNDDIRIISENWLTLMLGMVQRDGVGVVGPKLLFPDTRIQHAGVVLLGGLPGHAYYQEPQHTQGYALGAAVNRNYLAVTGACSITPKHLFEQLGGYSLRYPLNYNDVDYCIKAHELGYRSVYLASVEMYHYEGVSKEGGRSVADNEIKLFLEDWRQTYSHDPYYNPSLDQYKPYGVNS